MEEWEEYRDFVLDYRNAIYELGDQRTYRSDCSGVLRAWTRLPFTASDFYHRIFINDTGTFGAAFGINGADQVQHVAPEVGPGAYLSIQKPHTVLCDLGYLSNQFKKVEVRYI